MIITLDGYCSQGKSTVGRMLAHELDLEFFSIGVLFRFLAVRCTELSAKSTDTNAHIRQAMAELEYMSMADIQTYAGLAARATEYALRETVQHEAVYAAAAKKVYAYAKDRNILLDGRFGFLIFPHAYRNYYCISSLARRVHLAAQARNLSLEEAEAYIAYRDSFEKEYVLPPYVKIMDVTPFEHAADCVAFFKADMLSP